MFFRLRRYVFSPSAIRFFGQPQGVEPFDRCAQCAHRSNENGGKKNCSQPPARPTARGTATQKVAGLRPAIFFVGSYFSSRGRRTRVADRPRGRWIGSRKVLVNAVSRFLRKYISFIDVFRMLFKRFWLRRPPR